VILKSLYYSRRTCELSVESRFSQPSLDHIERQSNSDPIGSLFPQSSIDPIQETRPGVTSGSRGLIVANARRTH
jgi:hypothetical protein